LKLNHNIHLAYCTNIHRGESWGEIWQALKCHTLAVRDRVGAGRPYAIGLRLSDAASRDLAEPGALLDFQRWLDQENCYVFTINGFPYGRFHGTRVKEQVYQPDWTTPERLEYTKRLFRILAELAPAETGGSVSTVPCSYKEFITSEDQVARMRANLWDCVEFLEELSLRSGKDLHLGLEPEPLCFLETSGETVEFMGRMRADRPGDDRVARRLGVNYDTCHLAVEFEEPQDVLEAFRSNGIRVSKLHFSSALATHPAKTRLELGAFVEEVYFHQVVARKPDGTIVRHKDLDVALLAAKVEPGEEWRIHFHVPLHAQPRPGFETTSTHMLGVMDALASDPGLCSHVEMETYTWEVLPPELKKREVVDQLADEYRWTLGEMAKRGLA